MLRLSFTETLEVVILKSALVFPASTVTLGGTCISSPLEAKEMTAPPIGAGAVNVTVPVLFNPPTTVLGDDET